VLFLDFGLQETFGCGTCAVSFSGSKKSADDLIARGSLWSSGKDQDVIVVTGDQELALRLRQYRERGSCKVMPSRDFAHVIRSVRSNVTTQKGWESSNQRKQVAGSLAKMLKAAVQSLKGLPANSFITEYINWAGAGITKAIRPQKQISKKKKSTLHGQALALVTEGDTRDLAKRQAVQQLELAKMACSQIPKGSVSRRKLSRMRGKIKSAKAVLAGLTTQDEQKATHPRKQRGRR